MERKFVVERYGFFCVFCAICAGALMGSATVLADTCNPGEYMECHLDDMYGSECTDCYCVSCGPGQTSDGTGVVTYCPNQWGNTGCYDAPVNLCAGYTADCPGLGYGFLCKAEQQNCDGVSGCTKVKACNIATGATQYLVSGDCHLENNTCYSNTRACSDFPNHVEPVDGTTLSCNSENQHNQAIWQENQNAWYTGDCECKVENAEITGLFRCERAMSRAYVKDSNALVTHSVNDDIVYTLDYTYCAKCHAGYLPNIVTGQNAHYFRPAGGNGNWGVLACGTKVTVPDYAPGCTINFNLATVDEVMAACRGICPTGFETEENGATSINDCEPKYNVTYEDGTGTFVLTSLDSCP